MPDEVVQVPAIPRTLTGKKLEVPIKRLFMGADPETTLNRNAVADPAALDAFVELAAADQLPNRRSPSCASAVSTRSSAARPSATR